MIFYFPNEKSEWSFAIGKDKFEEIMNRPDIEKNNLKRFITLNYSSLDGGKIYHYSLEQLFVVAENNWIEKKEDAD